MYFTTIKKLIEHRTYDHKSGEVAKLSANWRIKIKKPAYLLKAFIWFECIDAYRERNDINADFTFINVSVHIF